MAEQHFISPERIKLLERLENVNAVSVAETQKGLEGRTNKQAINDTLKRLNQLGEFQRGRSKTSPRLRMGGTALSIPFMIAAAGLSDRSWGAAKDAAKDPWLYADAFTGIDTKRTIENPSRLLWPQLVVKEDIIEPTAQMIGAVLRTDDIPQEPYYGMGRQRGLLEGHAGIGEEERKRRTNIWT